MLKLPNGYGSVIRLKGNRRRPYAVRISAGHKERIAVANRANNYVVIDKYPFAYRKSKNDYIIDAADNIKNALEAHEIPYRSEFVRQYRYLEFFEKSADAYNYLAQMNSGQDVKEHTPLSSEPLFKDVFDRYVDFLKSLNKKPSQTKLDSYRQGFNLWSDLHFLRFRSITTQQLQDCLSAHSHLSKASVGRMITVIRNMYKYGMAHDICSEDRSTYLFVEYTAADKQKHHPFTEREINILWKSDNVIASIALILIYTGMRASEFLQMRTENIHLNERYMIGGLKTEAGRDRVIPIHKKIDPLVRSLYDPKREYLFVNGAGNPYRITHFNDQRWKPFFDKIGMPHLTHDARHTFATMTEKAGISEFHRKLLMGHKVQDLTNGVYTHVSTEDLIADIDKIP